MLRLQVAGRSDRKIVAALFVSHRTAGAHVTNILTKLGVALRIEARAWAIRHSLA